MAFIVPHEPIDDGDCALPAAALLEQIIPPAVLDEVVSRYRPPRTRRRRLPGPLVLLLVIALFLYPATDLATVLALLLLPQRCTPGGAVPAGKSSISRARYRWGPRPLAALMRQVCRPLATPTTPGAMLVGYRTVAFDASYEEVADTPENARAFGRYRSQYAPAAYPQLMGMYLVECGTHAILDACPWPCHTTEHRAVRRLLRSVTADMLALWDCGLHSYSLAAAIRARGAHLLARVPANQTFVPVCALLDGSEVVRWYRDTPSRRTASTPWLLMRLITYHLDADPTPIRLVTSLLDPVQAPALELVCGYHERWEIELVFDELGTHQRLLRQPLRSKKPRGVIQEFYGLVLAHYAVRTLMAQAAQTRHLDPDRISFARAARLLPAGLLLGDLLDRTAREELVTALCTLLAQVPLPPRRSRRVPRARKRSAIKALFRQRTRAYRITAVPPFRCRVTIHAPPSPA